MRRALGPAALRTVWLLVGAAIGLAAVLLLVGLAQVVGGPLALVVPLCLLPALLIGLLPGVRELEVTAARSLLGVTRDLVVPEEPTSAHRLRTAVLVVLHLVVGLLAAALLVGLVPGIVVLMTAAVQRRTVTLAGSAIDTPLGGWGVPLGLIALAGCFAGVAVLGRLAAAAAARLLGPTPGDQLQVALGRLAEESRHVRLARDLHDGIGHALTIISVQAEAGRRSLPRDLDQAGAALGSISATAREALGELDDLLGLLRDHDRGYQPGREPDLEQLPALLEAHRAAGLAVELPTPVPQDLPRLVSATAYRVLAEGLTNAQRYAGPGPVRVEVHRVDLKRGGGRLVVATANAIRPSGAPVGVGGSGRGLTGVAERVQILGGTVAAGPSGSQWVLRAEIPLGAGRA